MDAKQISVIVPVYNVENCISECIASLVRQCYSDLEIILVDDGSTDRSGAICDEYALRDGRIRVLHQPNGGLSDARNAGTAAAGGDFIFYLDADDCLEPDALQILFEEQQKTGADVVVCGFYYTYPDREDAALSAFSENRCFSGREALERLVKAEIETFAWGKLISSAIAKGHQFPKGKLFEDHFWTHYVFGDAGTVAFVARPLVHYRQREGSISYTFDARRLDVLDGFADRLRYLEANAPELTASCLAQCAKRYVGLAWLVLTRMKNGRRESFDRLRAFNAQYRLQDHADKNEKSLIEALDKGTVRYAAKAFCQRIVKRK